MPLLKPSLSSGVEMVGVQVAILYSGVEKVGVQVAW